MASDTHYIYNFDKIKQIVSKMKPKILQLTHNSVYHENTYVLSYDQVIINVKYNKLQNYKKRIYHLMDLLVGTNKNTLLLEQLLQEIDECITILEPLKITDPSLLNNLVNVDLVNIDLVFDNDT